MPEIKEYCRTLLEKNGYLDYIVHQLMFFDKSSILVNFVYKIK